MFEKEVADVVLGIRCGGRESNSETVSCCDGVIGSFRPILGTLLLWNNNTVEPLNKGRNRKTSL